MKLQKQQTEAGGRQPAGGRLRGQFNSRRIQKERKPSSKESGEQEAGKGSLVTGIKYYVESLILAQDERWRRA